MSKFILFYFFLFVTFCEKSNAKIIFLIIFCFHYYYIIILLVPNRNFTK